MSWWQTRKRDADLERELQSTSNWKRKSSGNAACHQTRPIMLPYALFANPTLIREDTCAVWSWNLLENLLRDLRIGGRT